MRHAKKQKMLECQEDFRLADENREEAVRASTDRVRMAADEKELETSFARSIALLDEVQSVDGFHRHFHLEMATSNRSCTLFKAVPG